MQEKFEKKSVLGKDIRPMEVYQKNNELRRDIYLEIRKLNNTLHTNRKDSRHAQTIERFVDAMIPSKTGNDPGRLPVYAMRPAAPVASKPLCVFCLVSCLIQAFWAYLDEESEDNLAKIEVGLEILKHINKNYSDMVVIGDIKRGYILELQ